MLQYVCDNCGETLTCSPGSDMCRVTIESSDDRPTIRMDLCIECRELFMDVINKKAVIVRDPIRTPGGNMMWT